METVFPATLVGLVLVTMAWLVSRSRHSSGCSLGLVGALLCVPAIGAAARPEAVPWMWAMPQLPVGLWLGGLFLLGIGLLPRGGDAPRPSGMERVCNVLALALSGGAFLAFLWIATTSAGGV